jgi:hypothetical protein
LQGGEIVLANRTLRQHWIKMGHSGDRCIGLPVRTKQLATVLAKIQSVAVPGSPSLPDPGQSVADPTEGVGLRILVIEDNLVNQKVAERLLLLRGYSVKIAANGALGVEVARGGEFDAILMDCQMPVMDGYEATRQIRSSEPSGRRTPIIALTASVFAEDHAKCIEAGMDDLLLKPFRPEQLYDIVRRWTLQPALK